jgi:RimJ/RimL family protein N-acetyltransferase
VDWQPREPPLIAVGDSFVLDRWRLTDGPALRRLDLDPDTARFFGYSVEQAAAMPDSHYDGSMRAQGNLRAWREGRELNLALRRTTDGEAIGWVELRLDGEQAEVSYNVAAELRGQGIAPSALSALLTWAATQIGLRWATWPVTSTTWLPSGWQKSADFPLSGDTATSTSLNGNSTHETSRRGRLGIATTPDDFARPGQRATPASTENSAFRTTGAKYVSIAFPGRHHIDT